jgi:hypothetical protein
MMQVYHLEEAVWEELKREECSGFVIQRENGSVEV